jgi:signal peptidase II
MAMKAISANRCLVFLLLVVSGCALDLTTKSVVFRWLGMPGPAFEPTWIWKDVIGFQTSLNEGALFGFGQGLAKIFAGLSIAAAIGIFFWIFFAGGTRDWLLTIALGFIVAGIFGNLYDRLGLWNDLKMYAVRDFILIRIGHWNWPNFNLADSFLNCGAVLLIWHAFPIKPAPTVEDAS